MRYVILLAPVLLGALAACGPADAGGGGAPCPPKTSTKTLGAAGSSGIQEITSFGDNPGSLKMWLHAPAAGRASAVVVAMHGCTQGASDYANAGWNELADRLGFAVVYPEQTSAKDPMRCFHWYEASNEARGQGEPASIAAMTDYARRTYGAERAFVTGLSAGAAMTAVMLATYPDVFEAGAIMAGLPYGCAKSQTEAYSCMNPGKDATPEAWAALVPRDASARAPRVSIWHGDADWIVRPKNEEALVAQWSAVNGVSVTPSSSETVGKATHATHVDAGGVVRVESWTIAGMGHGVALSSKDGCGTPGAYLLDEGICSTEKAAEFFGLAGPSGAAPPPGTGSSPAAPRCD